MTESCGCGTNCSTACTTGCMMTCGKSCDATSSDSSPSRITRVNIPQIKKRIYNGTEISESKGR